MPYAIGHVVLGVDLTSRYGEPSPWAEFCDELEKLRDVEGSGFHAAYSGGDDEPRWFGVSLGEFDECQTLTGDRLIKLCTASQEQTLAYVALVDGLKANPEVSEPLRQAILAQKAKVIILWGTS